MISAFKRLFTVKKDEPHMFAGTSAVLMAESRDVAKLSDAVSPVDLIEKLNSVITALISAIEKREGVVFQHIGGCIIAYWPPSTMPAGARSAVSAAFDAVTACGQSIAVAVVVSECALVDIGPFTAKRPLLVGEAYKRAEATLRVCPAGTLTLDARTLAALPEDIRVRFVVKDGHAELR